MIKPIYEFLMWDNCNNNCKFCFQKQNYHPLSVEEQKQSMDCVLKFLNSDEYIHGSHVLLVGGEIFDCNTISNPMKIFLGEIVACMLLEQIDLLYLNTNLIYKKLDVVYFLLDLLKRFELLHRLKFTTSYDIDGRFCMKTEKLMLSNLQKIKHDYPDCNIVVNMMLSDKMCDNILSMEFDFVGFKEKYDVTINFIPYIILDDKITAPKTKIFKTLLKIDQLDTGYLGKYIHNFDLDQKKHLYAYDKSTKNLVYCSSDESSCGHSENFKKYSDTNTCYVCDLKRAFEDYVN